MGSKIIVVYGSSGDFSQGIEGKGICCGRGFGLMVSVVVSLMLAVLPYARGRGFDSRSRLYY
jgi:hypothetical protein